jgi:hypothetical protein
MYWQRPADLLGLDLAAAVPAWAGETGPQRVALVCTNGKRDRCCAVRGRPVAAAIADATGWDAWESSHLGGHRFAATALLLPSGEMFGQFEPESAVEVLRQFDAGRIVPAHYRGQCAQPLAAQAALHTAAVRLGDCRRGAIEVVALRPGLAGAGTGWPEAAGPDGPAAAAGWPAAAGTGRAAADLWEAEVVHRAGDGGPESGPESGPEAAYRVTVAGPGSRRRCCPAATPSRRPRSATRRSPSPGSGSEPGRPRRVSLLRPDLLRPCQVRANPPGYPGLFTGHQD